jgi:hypothetical protein
MDRANPVGEGVPERPDSGAPDGDNCALYAMTAYACTLPHGMEAVQGPETAQCHSNRVLVKQRAAEFQLLQAARHTRVKARFCRRVETVLPVYCGVWSHSVLVSPLVRIMTTEVMTKADCDQAWTAKEYVTPNAAKQRMPLVIGTTNDLFYKSVDHTSVKDGTVSCQGGVMMYKDTAYRSMVVNHYLKLDLYEKTLAMDENGNTVDEDGQFSLICPSTAGYCSTGKGT